MHANSEPPHTFSKCCVLYKYQLSRPMIQYHSEIAAILHSEPLADVGVPFGDLEPR